MKDLQSIQLAETVKDRVTGFWGVVTSVQMNLEGSAQLFIQPPVKADGTFVEGKWFEEGRLKIIKVEM